jgi:hypothetical protein
MKIVSEEWKPLNSDEAVVILQSDEFSVAVFSHPYSMNVGDVVCEPLHIVDASFVGKSVQTHTGIHRQKDSLGHEICAQLKSKKTRLFAVGGFLFELEDSMPADLVEGDLVDIVCKRVDLW